MSLDSTQSLTKWVPGIFPGVKATCAEGWLLHNLMSYQLLKLIVSFCLFFVFLYLKSVLAAELMTILDLSVRVIKLVCVLACVHPRMFYNSKALVVLDLPKLRFFYSHPLRRTTVCRTPPEEKSAHLRDHYLTKQTQHPQERSVLTPGGIWTRNSSMRSATDPRLRPLGHWDRHSRI